MIEIPLDRLSPDILNAVIEEFILREGTDYGASETSMDSKIAQVRRQLDHGDVLITFDPEKLHIVDQASICALRVRAGVGQ